MSLIFEPGVEREVRARLIWRDMTDRERLAVEDAWQQGFRIRNSGSNPYDVHSSTWQWAAFEMGTQEADRLNR